MEEKSKAKADTINHNRGRLVGSLLWSVRKYGTTWTHSNGVISDKNLNTCPSYLKDL